VVLLRDPQTQPTGDDRHVLDLQRDQLGRAQRTGKAEQQQRPVAPARAALSQVASSRRSRGR